VKFYVCDLSRLLRQGLYRRLRLLVFGKLGAAMLRPRYAFELTAYSPARKYTPMMG